MVNERLNACFDYIKKEGNNIILRHKNKEKDCRKKRNGYHKIYQRKGVVELSNNYIKNILVRHNSLSFKDVPSDLISAKKIIIKTLREMENENEQKI
jgi:hypothetical protein